MPLTPGGTAVFQARAIPNDDHEGNGTGGGGQPSYQDLGNPRSSGGTDAELQTDKPARLYVYSDTQSASGSSFLHYRDVDENGTLVCWGQESGLDLQPELD